MSVLPASTTGSLSSITTTSLASEPGGDGAGSDQGSSDDKGERQLTGIKHEKWWHTTIQVAIPFFIAGIGTIGAGIILGRVEVSLMSQWWLNAIKFSVQYPSNNWAIIIILSVDW